jgi:hypothetical protein
VISNLAHEGIVSTTGRRLTVDLEALTERLERGK